MKTATIGSTNVNLEHPAHNFKNLKDLRKNEAVFAHLEGDERAEAQKLLWDALGGKESEDMVLEEKQPEIREETKDSVGYLAEEIKEG